MSLHIKRKLLVIKREDEGETIQSELAIDEYWLTVKDVNYAALACIEELEKFLEFRIEGNEPNFSNLDNGVESIFMATDRAGYELFYEDLTDWRYKSFMDNFDSAEIIRVIYEVDSRPDAYYEYQLEGMDQWIGTTIPYNSKKDLLDAIGPDRIKEVRRI